MRSRVLILTALVALAAVVLIIGVTVAGAGQSNPLPAVGAPDLLAKMAQAQDVTAVSGEVSWKNDLFGDLSAVSSMAQLPAQSPLLGSGSGRLWTSDAGVRIESQASGGDQVVVWNKAARKAWVYDYAAGTVKVVTVTGQAPAETASPAPSATAVTPQQIALYLAAFAKLATVDVTGQANIAGRDTYTLTMTPSAADTALGSVRAAIDGETMLPLSLEVYAKGGTVPVLRFAFDSVSYETPDAALFTFTPPAGATVTTKTIDGDQLAAEMAKAHKGDAATKPLTTAQKLEAVKVAQRALLTVPEVQKLVPYELAWARGYEARPYRQGLVLGDGGPLAASGMPVLQLIGSVTGMDALGAGPGAGSHAPRDGAAKKAAPASLLLYGEGFGTIGLAQTKTTPALEKQLKQLDATSQLLGSTSVNGVKATTIGTPLGGVIIWRQGDTTLAAAGMVPMNDLRDFAAAVR